MKENLAQLEKDMADFKEIHQQYRNQLVKVKVCRFLGISDDRLTVLSDVGHGQQ